MRVQARDAGSNRARQSPAGELWRAGPPDSEMRFSVRHLVLTEISGLVRRWRATLDVDFDQPTRSRIDVVVDAASLETGAIERDHHIRSVEFLKAWAFPEIRFRSREIRPGDGEGQFLIVGDLTIRDVTLAVTVTAERQGPAGRPAAGSKLVFAAHAVLDRQAFGLHWNQDLDRGGVVVGDKVDLHVRVVAQPAGQAI